jgi:tellurite resistance protein TerC
VLIFVGAKMLAMDVYKVPIGASLGIIAGILGLSMFVSLIRPPRPGGCASLRAR